MRRYALIIWLALLTLLTSLQAFFGSAAANQLQELLGPRKRLILPIFIGLSVVTWLLLVWDTFTTRAQTQVAVQDSSNYEQHKTSTQRLVRFKHLASLYITRLMSILFHPTAFVSTLNWKTNALLHDSLVFFVASMCLVSVSEASATRSLSLLWPTVPENTIINISACLICATVSYWAWRILRRTVPFRSLLALYLYVFSVQIVLFSVWALATESVLSEFVNPTYQNQQLRPLVFRLVRFSPEVFECLSDSSDFLACLEHTKAANRLTLIPNAAVLGVIVCGVLLWMGIVMHMLGIWRGLKRLANAGLARTTLCYIIVSSVAGGTLVAFIAAKEGAADCDFAYIPVEPTFNPGPLQFGEVCRCQDFPLVDIKNTSAKLPMQQIIRIDSDSGSVTSEWVAQEPRWSTSQAEHNAGKWADLDDVLGVRLYIQNGAREDTLRGTASGVSIETTITHISPFEHTISATIRAANAATITSNELLYGGNARVHTRRPSSFRYVEGSSRLWLSEQNSHETRMAEGNGCLPDEIENGKKIHQVCFAMPDGRANGSFTLGEIKAGYLYAVSLRFSLRVVPMDDADMIPLYRKAAEGSDC